MFGLFNSRKKKLQNATMHASDLILVTISHLRDGPMSEPSMDKVIESPYHSGFIQGKMASIIHFMVQTNVIDAQDADPVSGMVLVHLLGEVKATALSEALNSHSAKKSTEWRKGFDCGVKLGRYMVGALDINKEPELQKALSRFENINNDLRQNLQTNDSLELSKHENAIVALLAIWFFEVSDA